jgi:hypothetical protein
MAGIDEYTKLCLHMDDAGLSDSSLTPKTMTLVGDVARSATQSKFGGYAAVFDGTGDQITTPDSADWAFGAGNFTVDFWIYFNSLPSSNGVYNGGCGQWVDSTHYWAFYFGRNAGFQRVYFSASGTTLDIQANTGVSTGTWYHFAVVRNGTAFNIYKDGVSIGSGTSAGTLTDVAAVLQIGRQTTGAYLNGYIDEFRLSLGIARWTTDFTPPTEAYSADVTGGFMTTNKGMW